MYAKKIVKKGLALFLCLVLCCTFALPYFIGSAHALVGVDDALYSAALSVIFSEIFGVTWSMSGELTDISDSLSTSFYDWLRNNDIDEADFIENFNDIVLSNNMLGVPATVVSKIAGWMGSNFNQSGSLVDFSSSSGSSSISYLFGTGTSGSSSSVVTGGTVLSTFADGITIATGITQNGYTAFLKKNWSNSQGTSLTLVYFNSAGSRVSSSIIANRLFTYGDSLYSTYLNGGTEIFNSRVCSLSEINVSFPSSGSGSTSISANDTNLDLPTETEIDNWSDKTLWLDLSKIIGTQVSSLSSIADVMEALLEGVIDASISIPASISASYSVPTSIDTTYTPVVSLADYDTGYDLTDVFPFCIPFDIIDFLSAFQSTRDAPTFTYHFIIPKINLDYTLSLDFEVFDDLATIVRLFELISFCTGLAFLTKHVIGW